MAKRIVYVTGSNLYDLQTKMQGFLDRGWAVVTIYCEVQGSTLGLRDNRHVAWMVSEND